jgi:CRISPR-associated endoribonuclease Cas6
MPVSQPRPKRPPQPTDRPWSDQMHLVGIRLEIEVPQPCSLYAQYAIGLHAWFLDQVRQTNPELSANLHDEQAEKPFTLSALIDPQNLTDRPLSFTADRRYHWYITSLSPRLTQWLKTWLLHLPSVLNLRHAPLTIRDWQICAAPITYEHLFTAAEKHLHQQGQAAPNLKSVALPHPNSFHLSFISPTSFRHRKHHLPLPVPENIFHSYLRRWNLFSGIEFETEDYLDWVDECVVIVRHHLQSHKVVAGKRGSVTGFTGAVQFGLIPKAYEEPEFIQLFVALGALAPYCGTGHKTTFGLGQTRLGWQEALAPSAVPDLQDVLSYRIAELTDRFITQRQRQGGDRAQHIAETWATLLARRELGESLQAIAEDLQMPYETVKTYVKKARKAALE